MEFVDRPGNKGTNPHYGQKQASTPLKWGCVCTSGRGAHQKIGESDSWSSSWSAPLIRSEWQESTGPHRYLPSCCRTLPAAPIWPLTSPAPATMSIPFWLFKPLLLPKWWTFQSGAFISIKSLAARRYTSTLSLLSSRLRLWRPLCCPPPPVFACPSRVAAPLSTRRHKPVRCVFTMTTWKPRLPTAPCLTHSGVAPVKCFTLFRNVVSVVSPLFLHSHQPKQPQLVRFNKSIFYSFYERKPVLCVRFYGLFSSFHSPSLVTLSKRLLHQLIKKRRKYNAG